MSAQDRQAAVLATVVAVLLADAQLAALVGDRITDAPAARSAMPALTLRLVNGLDASSADTDAQTLTFDIDVWDLYAAGSDLARPRAVMAHIRRILHMQNLAVDGIDVLTALCIGAQGPFRDPDEVTLHGVVSLRVLCGHEAPI